MALLLLLRPVLLLSLLLSAPILRSQAASGSIAEEEDFSEELLLRPLPDRKVLAHFHFRSRAPHTSSNGRHRHISAVLVGQVKKFHVKEMELSFTQGRWNYDRWGAFDPVASNNAKPPGVELWAVFDAPHEQMDDSWKNLTHALSGLFCASINFLESSTTFSALEWGYRPAAGSLRDKAGLSALMDRPSIYKGFYHSQQLRLASSEIESEGVGLGIVLQQTLTVVVEPNSQRSAITYSHETKLQPSWSLTSIFGRKVSGRCVLAKSSILYVQLDRGLVAQLDYLQKENEISAPDESVFDESRPFDLGLAWKHPVVWSCQKAPLHASRFLMGSGNERGAIAISLRSMEVSDRLHTDTSEGSCKLEVKIFQVVPWYIKVYYHTLQVFVDEQPQAVSDVVEKMRVSPSVDKVSPGVMEMVLKFPCGMKSAAIISDFDKGFLHIDEYPPDANQGFDIPSAIISFPHFHTSIQFFKDKSVDKSSILSRFQVFYPTKTALFWHTQKYYLYGVPLTTPDFSMPYNVITITCTIYALYFGALLNVLRRRVGEEERLAKSKGYTFPNVIWFLFGFIYGQDSETEFPVGGSLLSVRSGYHTPSRIEVFLDMVVTHSLTASDVCLQMPINLVGSLSCDLGCLLSLEEEYQPPRQSTTPSSFISRKLILVILVAGIGVYWQIYFE
ncbi:hypothetical protein C1H46_005998 [Malus baccata]|uniref:GPI transamidase component PIG-T n=1 Tax=Malus baccata TaxID=106549 RepID=A0A540NCZ7_MALBA|nr:hypothetical protein C1H46_005998 [Malus baccata]